MELKEQKTKKMVSVTLDLDEEKVGRMMEICQCDSQKMAVRIMAYHALWLFDSIGNGFGNILHKCLSGGRVVATDFQDDDNPYVSHTITHDECLDWCRDTAPIRGFGVIDEETSEEFWNYLTSCLFTNNEKQPITTHNVLRTFRAWIGLRRRDDRRYRERIESEQKAKEDEEKARFAKNRYLLQEAEED